MESGIKNCAGLQTFKLKGLKSEYPSLAFPKTQGIKHSMFCIQTSDHVPIKRQNIYYQQCEEVGFDNKVPATSCDFIDL